MRERMSMSRPDATASSLERAVHAAEKHQIALYLVAIAAAVAFGLAAPEGAGASLEHAIEPVLAALLFATFLQVPFLDMAASFRDVRFLGAVLGLNFLAGPLVVWGLIQFLGDDQAVLVGVLLVLLTPCIDYVIVFSGLAGGAEDRLVAAAPLLMLLQLVLLPVYLYLFVGSDLADIVEPGPFLHAFIVLIAIPLGLAALTQALSRRFAAAKAVEALMAVALTGFEQTRSVAAAIAGDHEAAARVELTLPDTGVCGGAGTFDDQAAADGGCCGAPAAPELITLGRPSL